MKRRLLTGLLALSIPVAGAEVIDWSFKPAQVSEIRVSVIWPLQDNDHQDIVARVHHQGDQWLRDGQTFDSAPLARLGEALKILEPSLGLRDCSDADEDRQGRDIFHPVIEVEIRMRHRRTLRLRSASACAFMLPWNATDGETLARASQLAVGQAMRELIAPLCPDCEFKSRPLPEESLPSSAFSAGSRFTALYSALLSEWRRIGSMHAATWTMLHTHHLVQGLQWMDEKRFKRKLEISAQRESQAVRKLVRAAVQDNP